MWGYKDLNRENEININNCNTVGQLHVMGIQKQERDYFQSIIRKNSSESNDGLLGRSLLNAIF